MRHTSSSLESIGLLSKKAVSKEPPFLCLLECYIRFAHISSSLGLRASELSQVLARRYNLLMRSSTLLFLVKRSNGKITEICLAMKKRSFGMGRWNGVGGKVTEKESIEDAVLRETKEEIGVVASNLEKVAELAFTFPHKPEWDQMVHVYITEKWEGEPAESEEMAPKWFSIKDIPFKDMWPDDPSWLPQVIADKLVRGSFTFGEKDAILKQEVSVVESLS